MDELMVVANLRKWRADDGRHGTVLHLWCPGCNQLHAPEVEGDTLTARGCWTFNGDLEKPTISPSLLVTWEYGPEKEKHRCHSFVRDGQWQFLADCTHELAGQTVPLVLLPDWLIG